MLQSMRENTKWIMLILAVAFIGWLVFDVGMGITGRQSPNTQDLGSVDGSAITYRQWLAAYEQVSQAARANNPGQALTQDDQKALEDQAFEQLVQDRLLQREYARRGIVVTAQEIRDAARTMPPPEIMQAKDFQTNGQFDPNKWERFLASGMEPQFLLALEERYRAELPQLMLMEDVTSDVFVSDAQLWQMYRDQHDSVTVRALVVDPNLAVSNLSVPVTEQDIEAYYRAHRDSLKQPAIAYLSFTGISKLPRPADSIATVRRAEALRDSVLKGADFAQLAKNESADSASAVNGGLLDVLPRSRMSPSFAEAAFHQPLGRVGEPVVTPEGVQLLEVVRRTADSALVRRILLPIERSGFALDTLESEADSLDQLAADQTHPSALDSAARVLHLGIGHADPLYQGQPMVLGRYTVPDVGLWAFGGAKPGSTSDVIETKAAFYVFRLDSLTPAGVPPLSAVKSVVRGEVLQQKKRAAAEAIAEEALRQLRQGRSLDQVGQAMHLPVQTIGPFARTSQVPVLGAATEAVGVAFRLRVGERSGLLASRAGYFFIEPTRRVLADSAAWLKQVDSQRVAVLRGARQARAQDFMASLRTEAKVVDNRAEVLKPTTAGQ